ncbi:hypothetical protein RSOLAG22IIIB_04512 [Rhizoctonia solani]|uniref:Uncharacterized protein n=1 Tax=Rhizoctonia solani TaxID=456999 RepID=A0A0K6FYK8_9AGAM|nr:hypothetical protein RSOLAG22IIIB_04512 [Rhizoctonia solani]
MIHVAPKVAKSVGSDGTNATSPPFSPFSPATSVASDNTGTSDDHSTEPADLGAFHSVFRALSQLQISHPPRTMTSLATIPSIEEDDDDDDDTDRNFNSDDDSDRWASAIDDEQEEEDGDVVTPSRDQHPRLGSDTEGASSRNTDESSDEQVAAAYTYDVESAVEAEDSRTIWNHEPIASYLVNAATPAPDRQAAKLRQLGGEYGSRGGMGTYVDALQMNEQVPIPASFSITHEALLSQTHALAQQSLMQPPVEPQTYSTGESSPAPHYTASRRAASKLPPVYIPAMSSVPPNQHIPRTPGPGDPNLGALEQALEFLAAERTRVASQLDSSIEEYAYRTTEGKRRRRKRKKGVREEAAVPPGVTLALARSTSNLHLNNIPARSGNSNNSGSAHERTDTAVPSPSEGTSFSSSSADPRNVRRSYLHDAVEIPPVPVLHQQQRRPSSGTAYSAGPGMNPNMLAHEIIASYSVPTPPPTSRRGPRRTHARGSSFEAQQGAPVGYGPRVPGYDPRNGPLVDPRLQSIGQRLSGGSGSGSSPTNMEQTGESKVARLRMLAGNLAKHFPEDSGALRRAAEGGGGGGTGFDRQENLLYVFVDHSNILVGFLEYIKKNPQLLPPSVGSPRRLKPKILHTALVLLLERGRPCARRILVASSPLHQTLDGVVGMGYEVSVLQRVEIKEGDGASPSPRPPRAGEIGSSEDDRNNTGAPSLARANSTPRKPTPNHRRTPSDRPRYREEAVDELLQLKLLQTILDTVPATIVLATGDGASSQFNPDGFIGCVRRAVDRGWMVELVGWEEGVSRAWRELERDVAGRGPKAKGGFRIVGLERWVGELVDL